MRLALSWGVLVYSRGILTRVLLVVVVLAACGNKPAAGVGSGSGSAGSAAAIAVGSATPLPSAPAAVGSGSAAPAVVTPEPVQAVDDATLGANIALAALGGHVIAPVEPADRDIVWKTSNLIDGFPLIRGVGEFRDSFGWKPANEVPAFPYELVFGFKADREATLAAVVLDTASNDNVAGPAGLPKDVELWASTTSPNADWKQIATTTLPSYAGENVVKLDGVHAKYIKLVIKTSYDAGVRPQLGEVGIYEAANAPSIVADVPKNLLLPALGGSFVRFTSQEAQGEAYYLVDGVTDDHHGWSSGPSDVENPPRFPHELTFAFRDHRTANIDRVVISPKSGIIYGTPTTALWAKTIEVQTSDSSPWEGFQTVKTLTVGTDGAPITVPIGRAIRYLRLRILDNQGATRTTLGEVEAFEAATPRSLIAGRNVPLVTSSPSAIASGGETASRREREPNNDRAQADPLTSPAPVGGALDPIGDRDMFLVPGAAKAGKQIVTVGVEGRPAIRDRCRWRDALRARSLEDHRADGSVFGSDRRRRRPPASHPTAGRAGRDLGLERQHGPARQGSRCSAAHLSPAARGDRSRPADPLRRFDRSADEGLHRRQGCARRRIEGQGLRRWRHLDLRRDHPRHRVAREATRQPRDRDAHRR
jgi:hypothetical protein